VVFVPRKIFLHPQRIKWTRIRHHGLMADYARKLSFHAETKQMPEEAMRVVVTAALRPGLLSKRKSKDRLPTPPELFRIRFFGKPDKQATDEMVDEIMRLGAQAQYGTPESFTFLGGTGQSEVCQLLRQLVTQFVRHSFSIVCAQVAMTPNFKIPE